MNSYTYVARDSAGKQKKGLTKAVSSDAVLGWLREQGFTPISIKEVPGRASQTRRKTRRRRIKSADLGVLFWQLTTMIDGGMQITAAFEAISEETENSQLQAVLQQLADKVKKGQTLAASAAEFPKVFNRLSCAMILAGETSGDLAASLQKLAEYFDSRDRLVKKVKSAVTYPLFVLSFVLLTVIFIMALIIPRFRTIFDQMGGELPTFTRTFMSCYDLMYNNLVFVIGSIVLVVASAVVVSKTKKGHHLFSKIVLRLPLFGKVVALTFVATFCKTMSTLLTAGVSVLDVFDILASMTGNDIIKSATVRTREQIVEGSNISSSMVVAGFFPNMVVKMIRAGEESGSLPLVLEKTSIYYERKVDSTITAMTSMLEPMMIVMVGGIVSVVLLALYLPIFTMSNVVK